MTEPIRGANRVLWMRPYELRANKAAGRMAFQTNHEVSRTRDSESTITKDGNIQSLSEVVVDISLTTLLAREDVVRVALEEAFLNGGLIEFWDIDQTNPITPSGNTFPSRYYQGYITEWSESAGAEDSVEISLSAAINGKGAPGPATLTIEQQAPITYEFQDTPAVG